MLIASDQHGPAFLEKIWLLDTHGHSLPKNSPNWTIPSRYPRSIVGKTRGRSSSRRNSLAVENCCILTSTSKRLFSLCSGPLSRSQSAVWPRLQDQLRARQHEDPD